MTDQWERDGKPVLAGFIQQHNDGPDLHVWCRWCCLWHIHGLTGTVGDYLHRTAHCYAPDSPYRDTGYFVLVTDTPFSAMRKALRRATVPQRAAITSGRITPAIQTLRDQPRPIG